MSKKYKLPKAWTTVTPLSRFLALALFIIIPIFAFYLGIYYEKESHKEFPIFFCNKWFTTCDPNTAGSNGKCAPKTVCVDPSPTPTQNFPK